MDQTRPRRRTADLRQGRLSLPGAIYFVTFCTQQRAAVFQTPAAHSAAQSICRQLGEAGDADTFAATTIPDHVHLLFRLGDRLTLDRVIAKWRAQVRRLVPGLAWQPNYFEHRLRPTESAESYAWYVFMNPYRAGLIGLNECWLGWWTDGSVAWTFLREAKPGPCPQPEWREQMDDVQQTLVTGE